MIGGDFNEKTGEQGKKIRAERKEGLGRNSNDKKVNKEKWKLLEEIGEVRMKKLNAGVAGDEKKEYTYVGSNGDTIIDYVMGEQKI